MTEQASPDGLAEQLRAARQWAGITQEQLAGLSTVSVRAIRDLEQGRVRHPRRETLRLLAGAMRLSDARRAALELAVEGAEAGTVMREAYGAELAPPPKPLRRLVGRTEELRALTGLLATEHERLLSVVGLAGVGKTRLAQEAALLLHGRDRTPVVWVDMTDTAPPAAGPAGTRSPRSALTGWARSLALGGRGLDELASVIRGRATLLVLDGHDTGPHLTPPLLELLHVCERLKVLITTREPHRTPGNRMLPLGPLPVPDPEPGESPGGAGVPGASLTAGEPAVELMLSYVGHMRPDLMPGDSLVRTVARISRALDGVPRAMEAAASWLLLRSPAELLRIARTTPLDVVDDVTAGDTGDVGGEGLAALLAAAVARLDDGPAALLGDLSLLPDGWSADQAAAGLSATPAAVVRDVHALMLRGLVRRLPGEEDGAPRFGVLNLVRQLAAERAASLVPATALVSS
ncbi:helix-turn-helix domain-containing protein [Streptomyces sp. TX20-6-3]|uniref:helix-turn-helix domain-containing protein n=1 Tax=Streptomyces sp. TX20-6-3 TaxID=3028705 RepID=UPI0029AFAE83|nr:helix-turn-helix domain-containing protein [Streptomyces sp. TX20-6-3]MDX2564390.1 helix-turn-helix domain-containing protein [Streptomyces sp. TX20-6-3]